MCDGYNSSLVSLHDKSSLNHLLRADSPNEFWPFWGQCFHSTKKYNFRELVIMYVNFANNLIGIMLKCLF
jgi:hypothetical protein